MLGIIISSAIISASVLELYSDLNIQNSALSHYFFTDVLASILVFILYKKSVDFIRKNVKLDELIRIVIGYYWLFLVLSILDFLINLFNVDRSGDTSRILFQNESWYSYIRLVFSLMNPILCIAPFLYMREKLYTRASILIIITIASSILSGSKSGFILSIVNSLLIYRDLFGILKFELRMIRKVLIVGGMVAILNLLSLGLDFEKIAIRLGSYGESTIMIYASPDPTLACIDNGILANTHRGVARFFGDEKALSFDTLFGISLSNIFYGEHSSTGPNARIGAYVYCAFPGWIIFIYLFMVFLYCSILWRTFNFLVSSGGFLKMIGIPLFAFNIQAILDYNVMASFLTALILLNILIFFKTLFFKKQHESPLS